MTRRSLTIGGQLLKLQFGFWNSGGFYHETFLYFSRRGLMLSVPEPAHRVGLVVLEISLKPFDGADALASSLSPCGRGCRANVSERGG
jgi:hypothetical protein